jgi:multiple sugar transport system permease protein
MSVRTQEPDAPERGREEEHRPPVNRASVRAGYVAVVVGLAAVAYGLFGIATIDRWFFLGLGTVFVLLGVLGIVLASMRPEFGVPSMVGGAFIVVYALFPIAWLLSLSLKADVSEGTFLPGDPTFSNYETVFDLSLFKRALINSAGISLIATVISVVMATLTAYAIARLDFTGKKLVLSVALAIAMFPVVSLVGPLFEMWSSFGLYDTWLGLIIPYLSFTLPLSIWTLSAFFREIPWEMEQAAQVDGATSWQAFRKVIVPLAAPGVFTAAILTFFFAWNDFVFGISLASTERALPVPASLAFFSGDSQFSDATPFVSAAAIVVTVPVIVLVLLFQRKIVAGLTSGAVKG